jgi:hypothetical protein
MVTIGSKSQERLVQISKMTFDESSLKEVFERAFMSAKSRAKLRLSN